MGVVLYACNISTQQDNHEFEVSLGYIVSSRLAWGTECGHVSERKGEEEQGKEGGMEKRWESRSSNGGSHL